MLGIVGSGARRLARHPQVVGQPFVVDQQRGADDRREPLPLGGSEPGVDPRGDGAELGRREVAHRIGEPGRQRQRDDIAVLHAAPGHPDRDLVRAPVELGVRQADALRDEGSPVAEAARSRPGRPG